MAHTLRPSSLFGDPFLRFRLSINLDAFLLHCPRSRASRKSYTRSRKSRVRDGLEGGEKSNALLCRLSRTCPSSRGRLAKSRCALCWTSALSILKSALESGGRGVLASVCAQVRTPSFAPAYTPLAPTSEIGLAYRWCVGILLSSAQMRALMVGSSAGFSTEQAPIVALQGHQGPLV